MSRHFSSNQGYVQKKGGNLVLPNCTFGSIKEKKDFVGLSKLSYVIIYHNHYYICEKIMILIHYRQPSKSFIILQIEYI